MTHTYLIHYSPTKVVVKTEEEFVKFLQWDLLDERSDNLMERGGKLYRKTEEYKGTSNWEEVTLDIHYGWWDDEAGTINIAKDLRIVELVDPKAWYEIFHQKDGFSFWIMAAVSITKYNENKAKEEAV